MAIGRSDTECCGRYRTGNVIRVQGIRFEIQCVAVAVADVVTVVTVVDVVAVAIGMIRIIGKVDGRGSGGFSSSIVC
jgi:hypothetical protein